MTKKPNHISTIQPPGSRPPKVVAVVGARLNSSRLPRKHLLDLAGKPLIERVTDRLKTMACLDDIVVATTDDVYNQDLVAWGNGAGVRVEAYQGDVNDLMARVDYVAQKTDADVILYVCGDSPLIEPWAMEQMIKGVTERGGDISLIDPVEGHDHYIHAGFDVYARPFWDRLIRASTEAFEREHVGAAFRHTKKLAPKTIDRFRDRPQFARSTHRVSVDTPHDYLFMDQIYGEWYADHKEHSIVDLSWVIDQLLARPKLGDINGLVHQRRVTEKPLNIRLYCEAGPQIGMGHMTRTCVAALALQAHTGARVHITAIGPRIANRLLDLLPHSWIEQWPDDPETLYDDSTDAVVIDSKRSQPLWARLAARPQRPLVLGVDITPPNHDAFDLIWMPSIFIPKDVKQRAGDRLTYGPSRFLLKPGYRQRQTGKAARKKLIVLTGGADPLNLNATLPEKVLAHTDGLTDINWVKGPYATAPDVSRFRQDDQARFHILDAPENLPAILPDYDAALCLYGVTFYECLQAHVPTVVFDPIGAAVPEEWTLIKGLLPDWAADTEGEAVTKLADVLAGASPQNMENAAPNSEHDFTAHELAHDLAKGPENFAHFVAQHVRSWGAKAPLMKQPSHKAGKEQNAC